MRDDTANNYTKLELATIAFKCLVAFIGSIQIKGRTLNGDRFFYNKEGKLHRLDGPAIIWKSGKLEWFNHGVRVQYEKELYLSRIWKMKNGY